MSETDLNLRNGWYTQQIFVWDDGTGKKSSSLRSWSENLKKELRMKEGAMDECEVHSVIKGVPWLVYHELFSHRILERDMNCVYLGIEPRKNIFGEEGFYDEMNVGLSTQVDIFNDLFSSLPVTQDDIFIRYTYVSHDCDSDIEAKEKATRIARFVNRDPVGEFFKYNRGHVVKLGNGKPPTSRRRKDELDSFFDVDEEISFVYPDVFAVCASPAKLDYHESAKDVVAYFNLLRNLGWVTATLKRLVSIYESDGTRIKNILEGINRGDSYAFSLARSIKRKPARPLSYLNELAELSKKLHLEGLHKSWESMHPVSVYPSTLIAQFIEQLLSLRNAYADESLLSGSPFGSESKPLCYAYGRQLFPECDKGFSLLNSFAHLSRLIYTNMRNISKEEDFKNLVVTVLSTHNPITEAHHATGIPDIIVPCENDKRVIVECKIWRSKGQVFKDLDQVRGYIGPDDNCGLLVYFVPKKSQGPLIPLEISTKHIGHDSVCSTSDAIVELDVSGRPTKVPVALLFCRAPTERIPKRPQVGAPSDL